MASESRIMSAKDSALPAACQHRVAEQRDVVPEHAEIGVGRTTGLGQGIGIEFAADPGAGLASDLLDDARAQNSSPCSMLIT